MTTRLTTPFLGVVSSARGALCAAAWVVLLVGNAAAASDGPVVAWGGADAWAFPFPGSPPPSVDGTAGTATAIAAGQVHGCAIQAGTGAVVCWGYNDYGQATPPPSVDGTDGTATGIAAAQGGFHSCAIQAATGAVVCWGDNGAGQATPPPSVDGTEGTATAIAASVGHSCAIQASTGAVVCWGNNGVGQTAPPPSVNGTGGAAAAIAGGWDHSCAIQAGGGAVVCWGDDRLGRATPPPSVNGTAGTASAIAAGYEHSCAIQAHTGLVVCWGSDESGKATPPGGTASAIAASLYHSCAIQAGTGAVVCWGENYSGSALPPDSVDGTTGRATAIALAPAYALAIHARECSDGLDADGDGLIDYPADPGCDSSTDFFEKDPGLTCDDGVDNDGDGLIDHPADIGCSSPTDTSERGAAFACDDGQDDDGDGSADFPNDPGCDSSSDDSETSPDLICDDGTDNDGDGFADYPDDRNCVSSSDPIEDPDACDDGIDNDGNGLVDYPADPSCADFNDHSERVPPVFEVVGNGFALTAAGDGKVYGHVGSAGFFQIDHGIYTSLVSLPLPAELALAGFVLGSDGAFYGNQDVPCHGECGPTHELVKITSDGLRTVLASGPYDDNLLIPKVVGSDGALYGIVYAAGLFRLDTDGNLSILQPSIGGGFALGSDGRIYGPLGGSGAGTLFRFDHAGSHTTLPFPDATAMLVFSSGDGTHPPSMTLGSDGSMYGVTSYGSSAGVFGTVFRIDPSGTFESVYSFQNLDDGGGPRGPLLLARDGVLYGTGGDGYGLPTFFRVEPGGAVTSFQGFPPGLHPNSPLVQGNDCALYGAAWTWDALLGYEGVIYRLFEPGHLCQSITFDALPDRTLGDSPFTVTASASSSLPVSWSASGSCSMAGDRVTLTSVGRCTLTASQVGDTDFEPASEVSQVFTVTEPGGCADGVDNDGDGLEDMADPGCPFPFASPENPPCDDGRDNDGNGLVDFDDPKCESHWPYWETLPCGLGAELALVLPMLAVGYRRSRRFTSVDDTRRGSTSSGRWGRAATALAALVFGLLPGRVALASSAATDAPAPAAPFTRITTGDIVTIPAFYWGGCWGDYDDDGYLDLFVGTTVASERNHLYHNERNGTFALVDEAAMPKSPSNQHGCAWGDYDNDGHVDLIVTSGNPEVTHNMLYQNDGDGTFSWATDNAIYTEAGAFHGPSWGDYDNDGLIDLFIAGHNPRNRLFHNDSAGAFTRITDHPFVNDFSNNSEARAFVDYDDDGDLDLFVSNVYTAIPTPFITGVLYRNDGGGVFTRVTDSGLSDLPTDPFVSASCWADYDGDGLQDLFLVNTYQNFLYHNDGGGTFSHVDDSPMVTEVIAPTAFFASCAWGDYDNDGSIDLILTSVDHTLHQRAGFLYRNDGDGTFTKVTEGEIVTGDVGGLASWVDYDNDGFLDLFLARAGQFEDRLWTNLLYHNDGNANAWLNVKLVGTVSNRSAIGAKVRVQAFFRGASRWQLREISGGDNASNQQSLNAEFGLADATTIDTLRVEWPSGAVTELHDVAPRQHLTITEPGGRPTCADGIDNDSDGLEDMADPGCPFPFASPENPQCDDGLDNDGNGLVDFVDSKCQPSWPYWETLPCGLGAELALLLPLLGVGYRRRWMAT